MNTYRDSEGNKYSMETGKILQPSELCYTLLKHFEGCKLQAYQCSADKWTIGYGNTYYPDGRPVRKGDKITQQQAEDYLPIVLRTYAISVSQALKINILQHQYDALCCLAYNIGIGGFEKSTLLGKINKGADISEVKKWWLVWNKVKGRVEKGLVRRRKSEFHLYDTGKIDFFT